MKRIMNDVAVQTLLYTMPPQAEVEVFDAPEYLIPKGDPITSAVGVIHTVNELLCNYKFDKIAKAKIRRTEVKDGRLFLLIDTMHEQY